MAKVYFRYAAMNAGKSTQLLQVRHNYHERNQKTLLLKPGIDNRDGVGVIKPRIGGIGATVDELIFPETDLLVMMKTRWDGPGSIDCILVDEAQFLTPEQVEQLCVIADTLQVPVMCYGLRTDFRGNLFPGSASLMASADNIEEIKTICWCGKKATMNARVADGRVVFKGPQVLIGGNNQYVALCRKHWRTGKIDSI